MDGRERRVRQFVVPVNVEHSQLTLLAASEQLAPPTPSVFLFPRDVRFEHRRVAGQIGHFAACLLAGMSLDEFAHVIHGLRGQRGVVLDFLRGQVDVLHGAIACVRWSLPSL
ncbi:hypothetical protein MRX96_000884 [Rhipicephalus microplus]